MGNFTININIILLDILLLIYSATSVTLGNDGDDKNLKNYSFLLRKLLYQLKVLIKPFWIFVNFLNFKDFIILKFEPWVFKTSPF